MTFTWHFTIRLLTKIYVMANMKSIVRHERSKWNLRCKKPKRKQPQTSSTKSVI